MAPAKGTLRARVSFDSIYPELVKKCGAALDPLFMEGVITLLLNDALHPPMQPASARWRNASPRSPESACSRTRISHRHLVFVQSRQETTRYIARIEAAKPQASSREEP